MPRQSGSTSGPRSDSHNDQRYQGRYADTPQPSPIRPPMRIVTSMPQNEQSHGRTLTPLSNTADGSPLTYEARSSGPLGMRSLLNPQPDMPPPAQGRRRSAAQMESPSPTDSSSAFSLPSLSRTTSREPEGDGHQRLGPPRRILSPRSPSIHRARSLIFNQPETGSIDARSTPFVPLPLIASTGPRDSRPAPLQPAPNNVPSVATPPAILGRADYFGRAAPTPPPAPMADQQRVTSMGIVRPGSAASGTNAPTPYSSSAGPSTGSLPPSRYGTPILSSANQRGPRHSIPQDSNPYGVPVVSTAQSNYQLLTYTTQQGAIQIPVEVQAGSRQADEKRKRNAGASARFRQRRKEREKEASVTITRLEQELKERDEDVEFYRSERNALREKLLQLQPHIELNRPESPCHRPRSRPSPQRSMSDEDSVRTPYTASEHPSEGERNVRRRTSPYPAPMPGQGLSRDKTPPMSAPNTVQNLPPIQLQHPRPTSVTHSAALSPRRVVSYDPFPTRFAGQWPSDHKGANQPQ
ncbi:hypothetical protein EJ05DRAFT_503353 [Pseudovirgaria hyperparasitica]|uniref:BZIP domain-containing protein n=1 Tax=Pseudovirgaria hyperparasitica TaxID=470096 RepID=A0A6A6VWS4_9PEZI|nr:uncharacterized protein EJ05DRAFT_503353 [Pseudovirgaria hyperparasitica]KAF2755042.1 hypothetical protein EJ05DRAFT_503353 [Pseudovirgaria hyperparasitica]